MREKRSQSSSLPFQRILIANRGEICVRIARTLYAMGIEPIGVYSEADQQALHTRICQRNIFLGAAAPSESYLNTKAILQAAKDSKAQAIHPGYGFLSENAEFAEEVKKAGFVFIGPDATCIRKMGSKTAGRAAMLEAGVPVVPGSRGKLCDLNEAHAWAAQIGYPIMLKAVAGGGGKGMRCVLCAEDLPRAWQAAQVEAQGAFNNSEMYIEKAIQNPRHIEIQVLADNYGGVWALGERECSMQRRHQKIIEESPSSVLPQAMRKSMEEVSIRAARAIGYRGVGTMEFIVEMEGGTAKAFYFLEMNTRLQVEHPVTEYRFGLDLVAQQIYTAAGLPLPSEDPPVARGHAIEVRICAEVPEEGFRASPGDIWHCRWPSGPGVRMDEGVEGGDSIGPFYDSMIGKLIVGGETREMARRKLLTALEKTEILGISTNLRLLKFLVEHPNFIEANYHTSSIVEWLPEYEQSLNERWLRDAASGAVLYWLSEQEKQKQLKFISGSAFGKAPKIRVL
jgi:acetyl/propionyl-CoA carboxylase alpha subunit